MLSPKKMINGAKYGATKIGILIFLNPLSVTDLALKMISEALLNQPIRTITYKAKDLFN